MVEKIQNPKSKIRILIMGAAGRDFHNFNVIYRKDRRSDVRAFTAAQIPNISDRTYPPELAGPLYPKGIPIHPEEELEELIVRAQIDEVVFAYSDIPHVEVMHRASMVLAKGANFRLLGPAATMLISKKPVVAVCAVRTGAGKSQTTRKVSLLLREIGKRVVIVRHPMPYGDLKDEVCQRFASCADLDRYDCTIEEREEYEPHLDNGFVVYAGVDYEKILRSAEKEADVILWDGGNNDFPFYRPDLHIVVTDPLRPGHELMYHPGETNLRMAHVVVVNKVNTATREDVVRVVENVRRVNPGAMVIRAESRIFVDGAEKLRGKRVMVIEDGPTLTHGEMAFGAGTIAARENGAAELLDPRQWAAGSLAGVYKKYPHIGRLLPAMGYTDEQFGDMERTINSSPAEVVVSATPVDLGRFLKVKKPIVRVRYELAEVGKWNLKHALAGARWVL